MLTTVENSYIRILEFCGEPDEELLLVGRAVIMI